MFPQQIIEELLSVAHVQAVAARAGVSISTFDKDGACYWEYLRGEISENKQSVRIRLPRTQELYPESLLMLMTSAREYAVSGEWIC